MIGIIYKITINEKLYFGSCRNATNRLKDHICRSENKKYKHLKLYEDFSIFDFNIVDVIENISDEELVKLEQSYIEKFNTIEDGLNSVRANLTNEQKAKEHNKIQEKYRLNNKNKCKEKCREIRNFHILNKTFRCEVCDYNFGCNRDLKRHLNSDKHKKNIT